MKRRTLLAVLATLPLPRAHVATAQPRPKIPRIGFLANDGRPADLNFEYFRQGLRELGYVEGKNVLIEPMLGSPAQLPKLAAELVRLKMDVIVATDTDAALAAQRATSSIPIVFGPTGDPVGAGLVASLAHPGGNITGVSNLVAALGKKRLELLMEVAPKASVVGVLSHGWFEGSKRQMKEVERAAHELSIQVRPVVIEENTDFAAAFSALRRADVQSLIVLGSEFFVRHRAELAEHAAKNRLPAVYTNRDITEAGGLMSYGPSFGELYRHVARYVDRILKGAKPADLPVEGPTKFELVINLGAANKIGLTIPESVLDRADRVIQ